MNRIGVDENKCRARDGRIIVCIGDSTRVMFPKIQYEINSSCWVQTLSADGWSSTSEKRPVAGVDELLDVLQKQKFGVELSWYVALARDNTNMEVPPRMSVMQKGTLWVKNLFTLGGTYEQARENVQMLASRYAVCEMLGAHLKKVSDVSSHEFSGFIGDSAKHLKESAQSLYALYSACAPQYPESPNVNPVREWVREYNKSQKI